MLEETAHHVVKALNSPVPVQVQEALRSDLSGENRLFYGVQLELPGKYFCSSECEATSMWVGLAGVWEEGATLEIYTITSCGECSKRWSPLSLIRTP